MQRFRLVYHASSYLYLYTSEKWDILWYTTRERYTYIKYHVIENTSQRDIRVVHDGKVGYHTVEYTKAFLYSDWLYFPWHGVNSDTSLQGSLHLGECTQA